MSDSGSALRAFRLMTVSQGQQRGEELTEQIGESLRGSVAPAAPFASLKSCREQGFAIGKKRVARLSGRCPVSL